MIAAWLDIGASAALLGVVVVAAAGLGDCLLRALGATVASALERAVLTVTLGLCGLAHAMLLLGALHLLYPAAAILIVGACLWPGLRCARLLAGALRREERWPRPAWQRAVLLVLLAAIGLNFLATLAPVSSADAIAYRFVAIKHMVSEHRLLALPWSWRTYQPFHVEMLFLLGTLLKSDLFGALFAWLFGVLIVLAMVPIARRQFAPLAGRLWLPLCSTCQDRSRGSRLGVPSSSGSRCSRLLALAKLLEWCAQPAADRLRPRVPCRRCGRHQASRQRGAGAVAALLVISCWRLRRAVPRALATMLVPAVWLLALPWWIRSLALTGNLGVSVLRAAVRLALARPGARPDRRAIRPRQGSRELAARTMESDAARSGLRWRRAPGAGVPGAAAARALARTACCHRVRGGLRQRVVRNLAASSLPAAGAAVACARLQSLGDDRLRRVRGGWPARAWWWRWAPARW
ncbi:MAG: hypothetical protein U1E76_19840 [Planctomycetota bacterium]